MAHVNHRRSDMGLPLCVCVFPPPQCRWRFAEVSVTVVKVNKNAFKGFHGKHGVEKQNETKKTQQKHERMWSQLRRFSHVV